MAHDEAYEAELMLIEATSDFDVLSERESEVKQLLETRQREVDEIIVTTTQLNTQARKLMAECKKINEGLNDATRDYLGDLAARMTPEDLQNEIESEKARLDLMHEGNGGVIREYEERQKKIDLLKTRLQGIEVALEEFDVKIKMVRDKWEPQLDKLVKRISASFAFNMKQISCAGEVSVHKDEEYDQWAIQIQVKFRYVINDTVLSFLWRNCCPVYNNIFNVHIERTNRSQSSTLTGNQAASVPFPQSFT